MTAKGRAEVSRQEWLIVLPIGFAVSATVVLAAVLNLRAPDPPEDLRRALITPVTIPDGVVTVRIDIGAALARSEGDWEDGFALDIREKDIVARSEEARVGRDSGPAVLGGKAEREFHLRAEEHVVMITFDDTWPAPFEVHGDLSYPLVLDSEGFEVPQRSGFSHCTKDASGRTHPGTTGIEVAVEPDEVGVLTYLLGPAHLDDPC